MTTKEAVKQKWRKVPKTYEQAKAALARPAGSACVVCNSRLVLPVIRPPSGVWLCHCNSCGSEVTIAAMLNRKAWRTISNYFNREILIVRSGPNGEVRHSAGKTECDQK